MTPLVLPIPILHQTLALLRDGGRLRNERVALWLAPATGATALKEVYEPQQVTSPDYFHLPSESLRALMARLKKGRLKVAAQIHTHPDEAFHSRADARWAIVRHVGALSLVLPRFAATATVATFFEEVKTYELSENGGWVLMPNRGPDARLVLRP
jgi:proteasome lid subunit RPN8/RPN11